MGKILKSLAVVFFIYIAASCTASNKMKEHYAKCTEEYNQKIDKSSEVKVALSEIQKCVNSRKGILEKVMVAKSEIKFN